MEKHMHKNNTFEFSVPDISFLEHKLYQYPIIEKYKQFDESKAEKMVECGKHLFFDLYSNKHSFETVQQFAHANTCKNRFCSFCNWRRSRKLSIQTYDVLHHLLSTRKMRFLFITFTVKNPLLEDSRAMIQKMNKAFLKMMRWKRFKESILGFVKLLEIHPQRENDAFTHPHFHVVFAVPTSYFDKKLDLYITQAEWVTSWAAAMDVDYLPSVQVNVIHPNGKGSGAIESSIAELIKYPFKATDLYHYPVDKFIEFDYQLRSLRRVSTGGIIKAVRKKLNLDDIEDGDLVMRETLDSDKWNYDSQIVYEFTGFNYDFNQILPVKNEEIPF